MSTKALLVLTACATVLAGCVTEPAQPSRGVPVRPTIPASAPARGAEGAAPTLAGRVATPAQARTNASRVTAAVVPLGVVSYDSQVLPLVSPDGRFLAAQDGEAPTWPAILAEPGAAAPTGLTLSAYALTERGVSRVDWPEPPPSGLVLGRSASTSAFLVESIRDDGARWIGEVSFVTGRVSWLVQGAAVNAHATWAQDGLLIYARRERDGGDWSLVMQREGAESRRELGEAAALVPLGATANQVFVLRAGTGGIMLEAYALSRGGGGVPRIGGLVGQRRVSSSTDALSTYQLAMAGLGEPSPTRPPTHAPAILHPGLSRAVVWDVDRRDWRVLAPESMAAVYWKSPAGAAAAEGYVCSTPRGLAFVPTVNATVRGEVLWTTILAGPFVPRATSDAAGSLVLLGPVAGRPDQMRVLRLVLGAAE